MTLGPYTLVYNGELYNFHDLRKTLPGPFHSNSDTEVLLHLWARDGKACLDRLVGMFAFAIWDRDARELTLVRDRLGIKPLLYRQVEGSIAFASQLRALVDLDGRFDHPSIDPTSVRDFFSYKYIPTPKTIYRGVYKLPPAHLLSYRLDDKNLVFERYWQPESHQDVVDIDRASQEFEQLLTGVVSQHTLSDAPVGVFLSGGLDSTSLTANLASNGELVTPSTFTLGFDVASHDEAEAAREIARHLGCRHHEERATGFELDSTLDRYLDVFDEPFGDHGAWPMVMVSELAQRQVKVALSGEGGDELFAGYQWYDKVPRFRSNWWQKTLAGTLPPLWAASRSAQRRAATGLDRYAMFMGPFTPAQKRFMIAPELMSDAYDDLWYFRKYWREDLSPIKAMQWVDVHTYLLDDMLTKVDHASMSVSLEARPPFVDHRMVEFALSLHPDLLRRGGLGKILTRRYLEGKVPKDVLNRRKIGFSMPARRWVLREPTRMKRTCNRLFHAGVLARKTPGTIRRMPFNNEQTWSLMVLDRWLQRNGVSL